MRTRLHLESAIADMAILSRITLEYVCKALDFDNIEPPKLSQAESTQLRFLLCEVCHLANAAEEAFEADLKARREARAN